MPKILVPAHSPSDWRRLLADPRKHWRRGYSARALAYAWQTADDFPATVRRVFVDSHIGVFNNISMLLAIPEHQVPLPGGARPSQNDIFVLAKSGSDLVSITVEGKVSEPFGPMVSEWLLSASTGRLKRLQFLCDRLGLIPNNVDRIRYQLLHRTASALLEADRFNARHALMMIHSFSQMGECFDDFAEFAALYNAETRIDSIVQARRIGEVNLYLGWVRGEKKYLRA